MKRNAIPAPAIASVMGFLPPKPMEGHPEPKFGRKALVGQYTRPYKRSEPLPEAGRVSKGRRKRHERLHGTEGRLDYSETINARR